MYRVPDKNTLIVNKTVRSVCNRYLPLHNVESETKIRVICHIVFNNKKNVPARNGDNLIFEF